MSKVLKLIGEWRPPEEHLYELIRVGEVVGANYGIDRFNLSLENMEFIKRPDYLTDTEVLDLGQVSGVERIPVEKRDIVCILTKCSGDVFHEYKDMRLHKLKQMKGRNDAESVSNYWINYG